MVILTDRADDPLSQYILYLRFRVTLSVKFVNVAFFDVGMLMARRGLSLNTRPNVYVHPMYNIL